MQVEILYKPSYSIAHVTLAPNEPFLAEPGAMVGMSPSVSLETKARGGLMRSLGRSLFGGESFFLNTFRSMDGSGEIYLAPSLPGDVFTLELNQQAFLVQSGSFMACSEGVEVDSHWTGARTFFGGEGLTMLRCSGSGTLLLSSYGAIHELSLNIGQTFTLDTGHTVAFEESMGYHVRTVGGLKSTLFGGEGFVVDISGPGRVLMQTRSEGAFLDWLLPKLPHNSSGD